MGKVGNLTRLVDVVEPYPRTHRRDGRSLRLILVGILALAVGLVGATLAGAGHVTPEFLAGASNQGKRCSNNEGAGQDWIEFKIEDDDLVNGTYTDGTLSVTLVFTAAKVFNWTSNIGVDAVIAKGGSAGSYLYRYDPPQEETSDSGLTTPGQTGLSHISLCYDVESKIIVEKQTDPDGDPQSFGFTSDFGNFSLSDGQTHDSGNLEPDTYAVSETVPAGWDLTSATCSDGSNPASIGLSAGETVTCTFTNTKRGRILVEKQTDPDGDQQAFGFTASYGNFSLSDGQQNNSGLLVPGTYSVSETVPAGWALTSAICTDGSDPGSIGLAAGETVTCTFTNSRQGRIIVEKQTDPDGDAQLFDFAASYGNFSLTDGDQNDSGLINPGTYSVSESVPAGWSLASATCDDGSDPGSISLGVNETVTCTFANAKQGRVIVQKVMNGGTDTFEFSGTPAGSISVDGGTIWADVAPGQYTSTEALTAGWNLGSIGCDDGNSSGSIPNRRATFNVEAGETVTCTFRNRKRSMVIVKKVMIGGVDTFEFTGTPAGSISESDGVIQADVSPGTHTSTEAPKEGWALTSITCDDANSTGDLATRTATFHASPGETVTCTFTNENRPASLTVIKHVVNDNGGMKTAAEFPMTVTGNNPSAANFPGAEDPGTSVAIGPGQYSVTEVEDPSYMASYSADCSGEIALGESKTCTITNDDKPATLTVIKHVINDNGGTAVAGDFSITVTGNSPSPASFPGAEDPGTSVGIGPGEYNVTETEDEDYTASYSADCTGAISLGESKTCTITNNDIVPTLTLVKEVVNDNGGLAQPGDWTLTAAGPTGFSGQGPSVASGAGFEQGIYDLSESGPAGYEASDWSCASDEDEQVDADTVDVGLGDDITCTIVNDDQPASLTVIKHVINDNGGTMTASQFAVTVTGSNPSPANFPGAEDPGTSVAIGPGQYSVTEVEDPSYMASYSADCSGEIALGESKTCTITNDDRDPTLTLVKEVVNDNGGTALPSAWTLTAEGPSGFSGLGPSVSSGADLDQGTYNLSESGPPGYDASEWDCTGESQVDADTVSVALGDEITCTIVNDDRAAALIVRKVVVNDSGGTKQAQDFSFQVNGGTAQPFEADGQNDLIVEAGSYNVTEPALAGYTTSYSNCSNLVIANGGSATCTVTNNDVAPGTGSLTVSKSASPTTLKEPGGPVTFSVTITNTSVDVLVTVDNVLDDKFGDLDDSGGSGCFDVPINLTPGQSVNCTFERQITGVGGTAHVNTVTVTGHDPAGNQLTASDDARVDLTPRLIDLVIVKEASSPTPLNGIVNYSLSVTNRGPDTATDVQVADPAPAGITYLSASPSQGTCSLGSSLITCSLGTIAPGQTVTIAITARATSVGSHTNTATVTGAGGRETNSTDNVDTAVTVVPAPLKPPVVKPTPAPLCLTLTVSPQMIKADGKPDKVSVRVSAGSKRMRGVKVVLSGAGVRKSASSNGKGVAVLRINPKKAGIVTITALERNQQVCGPKRIGVVGVFLPPLTG